MTDPVVNNFLEPKWFNARLAKSTADDAGDNITFIENIFSIIENKATLGDYSTKFTYTYTEVSLKLITRTVNLLKDEGYKVEFSKTNGYVLEVSWA